MKIEVNHGKWDGGKGSQPRKTDVAKYAENYDRIFKKDKPLDKEVFDKNVSTVVD